MKREDWKGLGTSIGIHLLLLVAFALVASSPRVEPLGMVEVEFGPVQLAEPAARAPVQQPPAQVRPQPQPQPPAPTRQQRQTEPVDLPTRRDAPETDATPPPRPEPTQPRPDAQPQPQEQPAAPANEDRTGGRPDAASGTTASPGDPGNAPVRRAPFNIEGLDNRTLVSYPLPTNPGARGRAVIALCVAPDGRVQNPRPEIRTGTPALDNAAVQAVRQWRFDALPPAAPQNQQCGRVTFTFTLE